MEPFIAIKIKALSSSGLHFRRHQTACRLGGGSKGGMKGRGGGAGSNGAAGKGALQETDGTAVRGLAKNELKLEIGDGCGSGIMACVHGSPQVLHHGHHGGDRLVKNLKFRLGLLISSLHGRRGEQ
ncbi:hypothetical protein Salat_1457400 [Sesamum alatum]|uniref:Uncharacterized protein n=1 Tax=Sesamum alatum TaxID=300844 RepID=A0AAE1YBQ8_9LAMI|nr:hypothetical protein Salat_1457400 [Sesamum alatum]